SLHSFLTLYFLRIRLSCFVGFTPRSASKPIPLSLFQPRSFLERSVKIVSILATSLRLIRSTLGFSSAPVCCCNRRLKASFRNSRRRAINSSLLNSRSSLIFISGVSLVDLGSNRTLPGDEAGANRKLGGRKA